jgi:hypothetical protein
MSRPYSARRGRASASMGTRRAADHPRGGPSDHQLVSDATIKTHVARILSKLGLRDRTQAVVFAYESGLVRPTGRRRP